MQQLAGIYSFSVVFGPLSEEDGPVCPEIYRDFTLDLISRCDYIYELEISKKAQAE